MTFEKAARTQYLHSTFYTVWLVGPNGERESLGSTQRKNGTGLMNKLCSPGVQAFLAERFDASVTIKKHADRIVFSNGWRMEFGGTIRQEASRG